MNEEKRAAQKANATTRSGRKENTRTNLIRSQENVLFVDLLHFCSEFQIHSHQFIYSHFNSYHRRCIVYIHVSVSIAFELFAFFPASALCFLLATFCCKHACMRFLSLCYRTCLHCTITDVGFLVFLRFVLHSNRKEPSPRFDCSRRLVAVVLWLCHCRHYLYHCHCHWPFDHI